MTLSQRRRERVGTGFKGGTKVVDEESKVFGMGGWPDILDRIRPTAAKSARLCQRPLSGVVGCIQTTTKVRAGMQLRGLCAIDIRACCDCGLLIYWIIWLVGG